jgi:pyrimidine-specific ribonucleoside hydrolase
MKNLTIILFCLLTLTAPAYAHKKASWNVIVDTDAAADDFRMFQLILASPDFNLNAVVTNDGILSPTQGASRIRGMLDFFGHQGIPVANGIDINKNCIHRETSKTYIWPGEMSENYRHDPIELLHESLAMHSSKNVIIVSGLMSNLSALLDKYPKDIDRISRIIWYNNPDAPEMNYLRDTISAKNVISLYPNIERINTGKKDLFLNKDFILWLKPINNKYAKAMFDFCTQKQLAQSEYLGKYPIWDECLPMYLLFPKLFEKNENNNSFSPKHVDELKMSMLAVLDIDKPIQGIVWQSLPTDKKYLRADIALVADSIIKNQGYTEFQTIAMTNEFHGHLGIYSIIGAKMGLRAMDYFHVGLDELEVWSYAGHNPPLSCMHDGLQYSTGASLGYGSIHIVEAIKFSPQAIFEYRGRRIKISISDKLNEQFEEDIRNSIKEYGFLTDKYWEEIRRIGISYWLNINRSDVFKIETID